MELNMPEMWLFALKMRRIGVKTALSSISDLYKTHLPDAGLRAIVRGNTPAKPMTGFSYAQIVRVFYACRSAFDRSKATR
jgi:hypothetical protein